MRRNLPHESILQLRQLVRGILREAAGPGKSLELIARLEQINAQIAASEEFLDRAPEEMPKVGIDLSVDGDDARVGFAAWNLRRPADFYQSSSLNDAKRIKAALGGIEVPYGNIRFGPERWNPCLSAWTVKNTSYTTSGWGPLLYDLAIEVATERGGGLAPDRTSVSGPARAVWSAYNSARSDVTQAQLDISAEEIAHHEKWAEQRGASADDDDFVLEPGDERPLRQLTPDILEDDCTQSQARADAEERGGNWHDSPLSRAYRKPPTVLAKLRSLGLLRED